MTPKQKAVNSRKAMARRNILEAWANSEWNRITFTVDDRVPTHTVAEIALLVDVDVAEVEVRIVEGRVMIAAWNQKRATVRAGMLV
jgi:hypothetical protein